LPFTAPIKRGWGQAGSDETLQTEQTPAHHVIKRSIKRIPAGYEIISKGKEMRFVTMMREVKSSKM
jgi:hypothetical protein